MQPEPGLQHGLIDVQDSVLIVIDVQDHFVLKLPSSERAPLIGRICWLTAVAVSLDVPIIVTAEDIPSCGGICDALERQLPPATPIHNKMTFGLVAEAEIMAAIEATRRRTMVLAGLETDVCVAQSAIGLHQKRYRVCVAADASASPGSGQIFGLDRMRAAGVTLSSVKALYYEWTRTVAGDKDLRTDRLNALRKAAAIPL